MALHHRLRTAVCATLLLVVACESRPELLPVALPSLEGLTETAQQQIQEQHARVVAAADSVSVSVLGSEYGALGQLLFTYDFLDAAEPALRNAEALLPRDTRWSYYLGVLFRQRGEFEAATDQYTRVLDSDPDNALARLRLAEAELELGRSEAAKPRLESVLDAEPRNAFAHYLLGRIASEAEDFESAAMHYRAVLELQPSATQVNTPLGMAYRNLGDEERSRYYLARRGQSLVQLNDSLVRALEMLKLSTGATALNQGQQLIASGKYQEAIVALEQAIAQNPGEASMHLSLGVARAYAGDRAGAIAAFEQTLLLDPGHSRAHYNLGAMYQATEDYAAAEERFRAAIASDPRHFGARLELAELLRRGGRCEEAVEHFTLVLEIDAGNIPGRQHLALCELRLGRHAAARQVLELGLAGNPDHLGFIDGLARVLSASAASSVRDGIRAVSLAERSVAMRRRTETLETLAMAYAEVGRFDDAVRVQQEAIDEVERLGHDTYRTHLRQNLQRYERGVPCRTPWPEFMYQL